MKNPDLEKKTMTQFNVRIPMDCQIDFKIAIANNAALGHKTPGVLVDLLNYYTDYGLPLAPEVSGG